MNVLNGKFISWNGDSICAGAGSLGGYGKIICDRVGAEYENLGVGGGTITAGLYSKVSGAPRHCVCLTVDNMNKDADYAILEGGVNDASLSREYNEPLFGEITDGYKGPFDESTFCGAFESMLKRLTVRFAGKKYGYIAVHQMTEKYRACYTGEDNFYLAAKRICEKWGVPFLDLNVSVPPFAYYKEEIDPALYEIKKTYTKSGDGWHPNEEGYKKYYCDKIEAWLKSL